VLTDQKLDAFLYPSWSIPPRLIGDLNTPDGLNSGRLASPTVFPAITVPMGYVREELDLGLLRTYGRFEARLYARASHTH